MRFLGSTALLTAVAVLAVAGVGATSGHSAAATPRLQPFGSCGALLGYVKAQTTPLVGPYGFGGSAVARGATPSAAGAVAGGTPTAGVDYSGHQRSGAGRRRARHREDERHDVVRGGGRLARTRSTSPAASRSCSTRSSSTAAGATSSCSQATGCSCSRAAATGSTPLPAAAAIVRPYSPAQVGHLRDRRLQPEVPAPRADAHARRLLCRRTPRRRCRTNRRLLAGADGPLPFKQPTDSTDAALAAARDQNRASSGRRAWGPGCRRTRSDAQDGRRRPSDRSSSAGTSSARKPSPGSGC